MVELVLYQTWDVSYGRVGIVVVQQCRCRKTINSRPVPNDDRRARMSHHTV